ncbi:AMP-dependent synthetase and ligase [Haloterrigena turkmenica DSM 5511]|uniref:AMP-dependent synthetase and ligase n=1 Tax=Haloterrigena turkmenica (strain ATCC 51198 / DSM 5511 / JCM 9101 / NCIMB 13204 / VKM B-1734 / 4k) TaxID=543526 RepID=D2RUY4_HALTV|nr:long-chain fatty acid--CoA ligase [Haloterrigena turkmenica]ADB59277.1 AMP-dependent synthetase and ligase [Haloterrigena turkmenica DSM 5511]
MDWRDAEREYEDETIRETTLGRMFERSAERNANRPAQRYKGGIYDRSLTDSVIRSATPGEFRPLSYAEMRDIVRKLSAGFHDLGVDAGDRVGLFANTRMEWAQCDFALLSAGAAVTTVYTSSSPRQVEYLLDDPDADAVVVENAALLERVLEVEDELDLEFVVSIDELDGYDDRDDIYTLDEVYDRGAETFDLEAYEKRLDAVELDDLASLIYTSGTTGQPKGVQLTHWNFRSNVNAIRKRFARRPDRDDDVPTLDEESLAMSYLPLAHVFERTAGHFVLFASGSCIAYAESPDTLQEDFSAVGPTTATSVPRVYEKIYDGIREQASESGAKRKIFEWATDVGVAYQRADSPGPILRAKQALADKLVFSTVREALGGEIDLLISGGGSLSPELCQLYHAMGLPIFEGYGLTETAPVVSTNPPDATKIGTIGPALSNVDLRVDETVADQEAFDGDPGEVGELLVAGPNVTEGYWNKPGATQGAFTEDDDGERWFRTGDIVHLRPDGYLEFRDRLKQLIVLSTGKNVAPGPIEDAFAASEVVEQAMVVGDGEKFIGALLVPNTAHVREWADEEGIDLPDDPEAMCDDERVREHVQEEVDRVNQQFEKHETIKRFELVPQEFTEENDMLTPTMKKKRRVILERFEDRVDRIYADD